MLKEQSPDRVEAAAGSAASGVQDSRVCYVYDNCLTEFCRYSVETLEKFFTIAYNFTGNSTGPYDRMGRALESTARPESITNAVLRENICWVLGIIAQFLPKVRNVRMNMTVVRQFPSPNY